MDGRARIAWNLRAVRSERGLSQEQLAVDAELSRYYVSSIERGVGNPSLEVIERLSSALAVDIVDLLAMPPKHGKRPMPLPPGRKSG